MGPTLGQQCPGEARNLYIDSFPDVYGGGPCYRLCGEATPCPFATEAKGLTLPRFRGTADMERFSAPTDL